MTEPKPQYKVSSPIELDNSLVQHWLTIRQLAIEMGTTAERNLIQMGAMRPENRAIWSRRERRRLED